MRKNHQTKIDKLLADLPVGDRQEFEDFARSAERLNHPLQAIAQWWGNRGHFVSTSAIANWLKQRQSKQDQTIKKEEIRRLAEELLAKGRGISALDGLEAAVALSAATASQLYEIAKATGFGVRETKVFLDAVGELRAASAILHNADVRGDRKEDTLAGAYELARRCLNVAKDSPQSKWLEELLDGELKAIDQEIKK